MGKGGDELFSSIAPNDPIIRAVVEKIKTTVGGWISAVWQVKEYPLTFLALQDIYKTLHSSIVKEQCVSMSAHSVTMASATLGDDRSHTVISYFSLEVELILYCWSLSLL